MKTHKSISLKTRIVTILLCILIPLVVLLNIYTFYMYSTYANQVADLNRMSLHSYSERVSKSLENAHNAMDNIISDNYNFRQLNFSLTPLDAYTHAYTASLTCKSAIAVQPDIAGFFIYSPVNEIYYPIWSDRLTGSGPVKNSVREFVESWTEEAWRELPGKWKILEFNGNPFLGLMLQHQGAYLFCLMDMDNLASQGDQTSAFTTQDRYLTNTQLAEENQLPIPDPGESYVMAGSPERYMLLSQEIPGTVVQSVYLLKSSSIYEGIGVMQNALLIFSIAAILLVPIGYWWLSRALFQPMGDLVEVMETASTGDLTVRAEKQYRERELKTMSGTFNGMMDQIQALKIESYEKELARRQAQLSFLQMQIRPHFYLNCLKNMYGMAQEQQYADIQGMLVVLSDYLRYMMQSDKQWVTLEEELQSSRNYIRLLQYNMAYPPVCNISVDTAALQVNIPPITILSFVENSVKYAKPESQLEVNIRARHFVTDDGPMLMLSVQDNGRGFPEEMLEKLNRMNEAPPDRTHVGLYNVWMRLELLYSGRQGIIFSSDKGARIEIFLPIGETNDSFDS